MNMYLTYSPAELLYKNTQALKTGHQIHAQNIQQTYNYFLEEAELSVFPADFITLESQALSFIEQKSKTKNGPNISTHFNFGPDEPIDTSLFFKFVSDMKEETLFSPPSHLSSHANGTTNQDVFKEPQGVGEKNFSSNGHASLGEKRNSSKEVEKKSEKGRNQKNVTSSTKSSFNMRRGGGRKKRQRRTFYGHLDDNGKKEEEMDYNHPQPALPEKKEKKKKCDFKSGLDEFVIMDIVFKC